MKYILSAFLIFISAFFINAPFKITGNKNNLHTESPSEPYEKFMLQRTYPNDVFDVAAYRTALNSTVLNSIHQRSAQPHWILEGPSNTGGRFNCIAVNPLNDDVMYAGSANGGVWKTSNHGFSWTPVFDSIPYQAIGAIAINPLDTNEIWVGTGDLNISGTMYLGNGVYKSNNGGTSWTYTGLSDCLIVSAIVFNPNTPGEVLVSTMGNFFAHDNNRGIYKTTNSGLTFTQTLLVNDSTGIIEMLPHPVNASVVFATSFTRIKNNNSSLSSGTEVYVYRSGDFGQTWNILSGGLPNGSTHQRLGIAICKNSPSTMYALYSTSDYSIPELYKSTNGGNTWSLVNIGFMDTNDYGRFGWYFGKIYVDPTNEDVLYIPGVRLLQSMDGGLSWNNINQTPVHADGHFMQFTSSNEFIYCTDGGIYETFDGGSLWNDIEEIPNNQFYAITENKNNPGEYAGGVQDNGTVFGNASVINNFTDIYGGDGFTVAYTSNQFLLYSESQNGNIVYDDNFPSSFQSVDKDTNQNYNWHTPYFISHFGEDTLYFAGQRVMRIDAAPYGNYTNISPVLHDPNSSSSVSNISTINQSKLSAGILYAGTADGKVWNTLNGGISWNDITPFQGISYYVTRVMPSPNDAATAYVTRSGYRRNDNTPLIYKTSNDGSTWTNISGDLPQMAVNDIEIYPGSEDLIFIANDAGVYYTENGGLHWERLGKGMPYVAVLDIELNLANNKIIAGTFGRSIYTIDVMQIVTATNFKNQDISFSLFPNPVSDFLIIKSDSQIETASVYNITGEIMLTFTGNSIAVDKLAPGKYFVKIHHGEKRTVKGFVKI